MAQSQSSPSTLRAFIRWLRLKNYQYEVTFSLYMLTQTEKVIFNSLIFLLFSMFLTAAYVYLPNHIISIYNHAWYYLAGDPVTESFNNASISGFATSATNLLPLAAATATAAAAEL